MRHLRCHAHAHAHAFAQPKVRVDGFANACGIFTYFYCKTARTNHGA